MIFRTPEELHTIAQRMTDAYTAGYQDTFDGKPAASYSNRHEQEAYQMGKSRCEAEMRVEYDRIG